MAFRDFPQGLQSGVPASIEVADKFGEREVFSTDGTLSYLELHDCGIIYVPDSPYVVCVMTRGHDFNSLASIIGDVSKIVYEHIAAQHR